jgi:hypothetical protein
MKRVGAMVLIAVLSYVTALGCVGKTNGMEGTVGEVSRAQTAGDKAVICHIPPGQPAARQTITVSEAAVSAHLAHGDTAGACPNLCTSSAQCDDGNLCTSDSCGTDGTCLHAAVNCDDGNACTQDSCAPNSGCINAPVADGTACNDGNACTQTDNCQVGVCAGSNPVTCGASDQCHAVGACNPTTGACSNPAVADGTRCNDGNACTETDTCEAGICLGQNFVVCTAPDQCQLPRACDPASGCPPPTPASGTPCQDPCWGNGQCSEGACTVFAPIECLPFGTGLLPGHCIPTTPACVSDPVLTLNQSTCPSGWGCILN